MLDSTYTNASDPNSMRDTGGTRNCEYVAQVGEPLTKMANLPSQHRETYDRYLVEPHISNASFYSYGGLKRAREELLAHDVVNPRLLPNSVATNRTRKNFYPANRCEAVNDYTKNMSQSIFNPGERSSTFGG